LKARRSPPFHEGTHFLETFMNRSFRFVLAAAAAVMTASVAASAQEYVSHHVDITYGDLDLSTASGQAVLQERIDSAAAMACGGSAPFVGNYRDAPQFYDKEFKRCRANAREQAVASLASHGVRVAQGH
jgi:UrcA family protein